MNTTFYRCSRSCTPYSTVLYYCSEFGIQHLWNRCCSPPFHTRCRNISGWHTGHSSDSCCCNGSVGLIWHTCILYVEEWELELHFYPSAGGFKKKKKKKSCWFQRCERMYECTNIVGTHWIYCFRPYRHFRPLATATYMHAHTLTFTVPGTWYVVCTYEDSQ